MSALRATLTGHELLLDVAMGHHLTMNMDAVDLPGPIAHEVHTESVLQWDGVTSMMIVGMVDELHRLLVAVLTNMDHHRDDRMMTLTTLELPHRAMLIQILMPTVGTTVARDPRRRHLEEAMEIMNGGHIGSMDLDLRIGFCIGS